jgi:hypothetical protein
MVFGSTTGLSLVAYGVMGAESTETWTWFIETKTTYWSSSWSGHSQRCMQRGWRLQRIASLGKWGAWGTPGCEFPEEIQRAFILYDNLCSAAKAYIPKNMLPTWRKSVQNLKYRNKWMSTNQNYGLQTSSMRSAKSSVSNNNLADSFNSKTKKLKALPIIDLLDANMQLCNN